MVSALNKVLLVYVYILVVTSQMRSLTMKKELQIWKRLVSVNYFFVSFCVYFHYELVRKWIDFLFFLVFFEKRIIRKLKTIFKKCQVFSVVAKSEMLSEALKSLEYLSFPLNDYYAKNELSWMLLQKETFYG